MFQDSNLFMVFLKEVFLKCKFYLPSFLFNRKLEEIDTVDTIIVFDGHTRISFLKWLRKVNPDKRIILWLWNTAEELQKNLSLAKVPEDIEIWSYSEYDCKKYNLKYNTTFYWNDFILPNAKITRDVYFIGKDKGRFEKVKKTEEICNKFGLSCLFQVVPTHKYSLRIKKYCMSIKYEDVQKNIAESRAILDIKVSKTAGPSLRPLEAAFYKKKLITDDRDASSFKFYRKENVFILGVDDTKQLLNFIKTDFTDVTKCDIEYYNVQNWLARFSNEIKERQE